MLNSLPQETLLQEHEETLLFAKSCDGVTIINQENTIQEEIPLKVYENSSHISTRSSSYDSQGIQILSSIKATIFEVSNDFLKLKINEDTFINIPKIVFRNKEELIKYGQNVIYSIKKNESGIRFQDIDPDVNVSENPYKARVLDVLNKIKDKDEN